ncbi:MAG: response regulator [Chitinophagaceae bacterium]
MKLQEGPIIVIDDDLEDLDLIEEVLKSIDVSNEIIRFENGKDSLVFLRQTQKQPFFILCDVNMPVMNGFDLREEINKDDLLRFKAIPFLFLSTSAKEAEVLKAYMLTVQGYLKKPNTFSEFQNLLKDTVAYWENCLHPNSF